MHNCVLNCLSGLEYTYIINLLIMILTLLYYYDDNIIYKFLVEYFKY